MVNNSKRVVEVVEKSFSYLNTPHYKWNGRKMQFMQIDADGNFIKVQRGRKRK